VCQERPLLSIQARSRTALREQGALIDGDDLPDRPLDYDYVTAAAKIRNARLPEEYAASLETGLWPTSDVLPLKEVHDRGVALEPGSAFWSRPPQLEGTVLLRKRSPVCTQHWPRSNRDTIPKIQSGKAPSAPIATLPNRRAR
jgi:hypothetical protein